MKQWWPISLGIVTAMGGFLDASTIASAGEAGSRFGLGLVWALVFATLAVIPLIEMVGRFSSVSHKPYAAAIRENFGLRFFCASPCFSVRWASIRCNLLTGPQAGAGRVAGGLRRVCAWVLRDRFESRIPLEEVHAFGPTIILRKQAREYQVGQSERWIVRHLLRWIPGSGD
ncbi:MAG TPA: divalent metal cation transporter [Ktedonobacteraceae bacterium]|nr:divalent metal cation transporter [Ktedonobacteraceae bacterium]